MAAESPLLRASHLYPSSRSLLGALRQVCVGDAAATFGGSSAGTTSLSHAAAAYVVYVLGARSSYEDADSALYASVDFGASWVALSGINSTTPTQGLGDHPEVLEASLQEPGVMFVGTAGRGAYWRNVSADLTAALLKCEDDMMPLAVASESGNSNDSEY